MEKYIKIHTSDGFEINGVLNRKEKSEKLIIFCHGFQGKFNRHLFHNGAKYFTQNGYTTFRFNFYDTGEKNRKLHHCDFNTHGKDIDTVVKYFLNNYEDIILIGHSFGGLSILYSSQNVSQNVLWDSSLSLNGEGIRKLKYFFKYYFTLGISYFLVNKNMFWQYENESRKKIESFLVPTSIICAEKSSLPQKWERMKDKLNNLKNFYIIPGASHSFDEEGKEDELFEKTLNFIEK